MQPETEISSAHAEADLWNSEERFRLIYEHSATGVAIADVAGRLIQCNPAYCKMTGYSETELKQLNFPMLIHPDDREANLSLVRRVMSGEIPSFEIENRYVSKSGAPVWVHKSVSMLRDMDGRPREIFALVTDITLRKRAEEQDERGFSTLQLLINSVPAYVSYVDAQERYQLVNRQYEEYFGMPAVRIVGKHLREVQSPEAYQIMEPHVRAALSGEVVRYQSNPPAPDGGCHWFDIHYIPRKEPGGRAMGFFVLVFDITEHKKAEDDLAHAKAAAEEANQTKDNFLAILGHELRNPLAPIRNSVAILKHAGSPEPVLIHASDMIDRQVTHMSRLIDDLLDVSRITQGKIILRKEDVDLVRKINTVVEDYRAELSASGIEIEVRLPAEPVWVRGDKVRLSQILGNLLNNAAKFTDWGGRVTIALSTSPTHATLSVRDTGIGIAAEALKFIFKPFAQLERSMDRSHGGLGLGLSLVQRLVELHGGTVRASSPGPGKGAEFVVTLPRIINSVLIKTAEAPPAMTETHRRRILIIEDNVDAAQSLRVLFELNGHSVEVAQSGKEALQLAPAHKPEVVFCDIELCGDMNGFDVVRAILANGGVRPVRLVALTGLGQSKDRKRSQEAGFDCHLTKPADPQELLRLAGT